MDKIDSSTYKSIKNSRKKSDSHGKGCYGHSRHYRNNRLLLSIIILILIITDVVFSLVMFHTRKTLFVIVACVMAIPFARNLLDFFMSLKARPLDKDEYEKTNELSNELDTPLLYDITITETDGIVYIPCLTIENNNIICYTPDEVDSKKREKIKKYISGVNDISKTNYRIFVTENFNTFSKELKKLHKADDKTSAIDKKVRDNLLSMGF